MFCCGNISLHVGDTILATDFALDEFVAHKSNILPNNKRKFKNKYRVNSTLIIWRWGISDISSSSNIIY